MSDIKIGVIIATSMGRTENLFSCSLNSVLLQTRLPDTIAVVDDNNFEEISIEIKARIEQSGNPLINYIKNKRTKNMSGTGAWNTGIMFLSEKLGNDSYITILDDDDSWDPEYLAVLEQTISQNKNAVAVFPFLKRSDCDEVSTFIKEDLTVKNFLIGDPGIQGSNMCFKTDCLLETGGFDENLASCTDRDLMIRFLQKYGNENVIIIEQKLVNHFAGKNTVTANYEKKKAGLDSFYSKHIGLFDFPTLEKSLRRAVSFFKYPDSEQIKSMLREVKKQYIAVGIAMHNSEKTIRRCLLSVLGQQKLKRELIIVLANDTSTDNWEKEVFDLLQDRRIHILNLNNHDVVKTRNDINSFITQNLRNVVLIGRLDADDEYSDEFVLSEIEKILDSTNPDAILAGNYLRLNGKVIERKNPADKRLKNKEYVLKRLKQMSEGVPEGELPSCNLFVKPEFLLPYPDVDSGEDHALLAHYLMNQEKYDIFFAENLLLTIYNLDGATTQSKKKSKTYINCRQELYNKSLENKI
ncbi:glycosyltransferase family 2 protein [bacterium]|nr:glycosyltransferase family 2 protein [bacterium]